MPGIRNIHPLHVFVFCGVVAFGLAGRTACSADSDNAYASAGTFTGTPVVDAVDRDSPPVPTELTASGQPNPYMKYGEFQTTELFDAIDRDSPPAHGQIVGDNPYMKYDEFHTSDLLDSLDHNLDRHR